MRANYSPSIFREDILNEQDGCKPEHNGKPLVDHIDGKASNNRRDNLRCPNCDSQLDTYKSKNSDRENHR